MSTHAELSLSDISGIVKRKFGIFVGLFLTVVVCAGLLTFVIPQAYKATAKILIRQDIDVYPEGLVSITRPEAYLLTQKEILSSRVVVDSALASVQSRGMLKNATYDDVRNDITISYLNDSDILAIEVMAQAPRDAAEFANALADSFIEYHKRQRVAFVDSHMEVLTSELSSLQSDIDTLKKKISAFGGAEQVNMYVAQVPLYIEKMLAATEQNRETEADLARLKDQLKRTNDILSKGSDSIFFPVVPASAGRRGAEEGPMSGLSSIPWLRDIKSRLSQIQEKLAMTNAEYTETSPEVSLLHAQTEALRENLNRELNETYAAYSDYYGRYIGVLEARVKQGDETRSFYQDKIDEIKQQIRGASSDQMEQMMLLKNYEAVEKVQGALLKKQKELQYLKDQTNAPDMPNIRVFEEAYVPRKPARPDLFLNLILGCILGSVIGFLGALFSEKSSPTPGHVSLANVRGIGPERRSMRRIQRDMDVSCGTSEENRWSMQGATSSNISGTGIHVQLKKDFPVGTNLFMEIRTAANETVRAAGRIVWREQGKKAAPYGAGVCFTNIDSKEREKLIRSLYGEEFHSFA